MKSAIIDMDIDFEAYDRAKNTTQFYMVSNGMLSALDKSFIRHGFSHGGLSLHYYSMNASSHPNYFILLEHDENGLCNVNDVIVALNWCAENDIKLISLSMGTTHHYEAEKLWSVTEQLFQHGIILVAAASNERNLTCAAIISKYTSVARLGSLRIFHDERLNANVDALIASLNWCLCNKKTNMKVE